MVCLPLSFNGKSSLAVQKEVGNRYTILAVSRFLGNDNERLLTSRTQNWLLGYHGNFEDCYHPVNGWVVNRTVRAYRSSSLHCLQYRRAVSSDVE